MNAAVRRCAMFIAIALAGSVSLGPAWGQTNLKAAPTQQDSTKTAPKGSGPAGEWIADVERPADSKNKTPTITAKCHQVGSSRTARC
jgi:hypothetical protein